MSNEDDKLLHSVKDVFSCYLEKYGCVYYNIPDYQRGYKWTARNVSELLDDIFKFGKSINTKENKKFYCLQNITICKACDGQYFNVVDGQQRLTTLSILLAYLCQSDLVSGKIKYSIREKTHNFLTKVIYSGKIWDTESSQEFKPEFKDQYYLMEVAKSINNWFLSLQINKEFFLELVFDHTYFIVNQLNDNEEQIFASLNGAKVNLDGADLLRACMMTRSAKEKFGESAIPGQISEFRVRMGIEIDEMNSWWSRLDVFKFFKQMIPESTEKNAKDNGFDLKMFPINLLYAILFEIHHNEKQDKAVFSFRFFEYGLDIDSKPGNDNWELYAEARKLHLEMQDWFNNKYIYHYLGYLFFRYKSKTKFSDIYKQWLESETKSDFINKLKQKIIDCITLRFQSEDEEPTSEVLCKNITDIMQDWYSSDSLFDILILLDIILLKVSEPGRLPVDYFTKCDEDKEHIGCQTPNGDDCADKQKWLDWIDSLKKLYDNLIKETDVEGMKAILKDDNVNKEQRDSLIKKLNKYGLNSIGNMVLLDSHINRSYGNNSFSDKQHEIINKYYKSRYIRPHTLMTFIKANQKSEGNGTEENRNKWMLEDIDKNAKYIATSLDKWINEKDKL
jgi:uncharacterized protein with ParB-like and HNH nuclease domain